jgi:tetratricopeptide (TPR) repeat protein
LQAYDEVLAAPSIIDKESRSKLIEACQVLVQTHRCWIIERIGNTLDSIEKLRKGTETQRPEESESERLERYQKAAQTLERTQKAAEIDPPPLPVAPEVIRIVAPEVLKIIAWTRAIFDIEIGRLWLGAEKFGESERFLRRGASRLEQHYPAEVEQLRCANESLAEALRRQSNFVDALQYAKKAVALDPFSASASSELGMVYFDLADYDQADKEFCKSHNVAPFDYRILRAFAYTAWNRGAGMANRDDRSKEFGKVIGVFKDAVLLPEKDDDPGDLHYWLGRFHGELREYDSSVMHYQMARALGAFPIECRLYLGWVHLEQDLLEPAEKHLRDALYEISQAREEIAGRYAECLRDRREWLRRPRDSAEGKVPPGYFLLNVCLLLALVLADRGRDIARANRKLGFVKRHWCFLGEPAPRAGRDERVGFEARRRELKARYEDYLGWVCHLDSKPKQALEHLEASVKMRANPESLWHLARVYLDQGKMDRARECCNQARTADIRGVFVDRIGKIEDDIKTKIEADTMNARARKSRNAPKRAAPAAIGRRPAPTSR